MDRCLLGEPDRRRFFWLDYALPCPDPPLVCPGFGLGRSVYKGIRLFLFSGDNQARVLDALDNTLFFKRKFLLHLVLPDFATVHRRAP